MRVILVTLHYKKIIKNKSPSFEWSKLKTVLLNVREGFRCEMCYASYHVLIA